MSTTATRPERGAAADGQAASPDREGIRFRPDIEGLRAVAVLMVVLGHLKVPGFGAGFVGVDVFFVISGFLITSLLAAEYARSESTESRGRISIRGFYRRRALRILPAALVTIAAVLIAGKIILNRIAFVKIQSDALWATFFGTNIQLIREAQDYFQRGLPDSPLQNFWSLAVEEQYYVVWPACFAAVAFVAARRARRGSRMGAVRIAVAVIGIASLAWSIVASADGSAAAYFSTLTRAWQLALGAVIALSPALVQQMRGRSSAACGLSGLLLLGTALAFCAASSGYPGYQALLPAGGAALLICAGLGASRSNHAGMLLSLTPFRLLGRISYSLYLWHWPIIVFAGVLYGSAIRSNAARLELLAISIAVAALSYLLIERPFVRLAHRSGRASGSPPRAARIAMAVLMFTAVAVIAAFARPLPDSVGTVPSAGPELTKLQWRIQMKSAVRRTKAKDEEMKLASSIALQQLVHRGSDQRAARTAEQDGIKPECVDTITITSVKQAEQCSRFGGGRGDVAWPDRVPKSVAVVGNSFAAQWVVQLTRLLPKDVTLIPLTITSCPTWATGKTGQTDSHGTSCDRHRAFVIRALKRMQPGLIVTSYQRVSDALAQNVATANLMTRLNGLGNRVLFLGPAPVLQPLAECLSTTRSFESCNRKLTPADRDSDQQLAKAVRGADADYMSTQRLLCLDDICPAFVAGRPTRRDGIHLSKWATRGLAAWVDDALQRSLTRAR